MMWPDVPNRIILKRSALTYSSTTFSRMNLKGPNFCRLRGNRVA
jgi:hypothetical protein